MIKINAGFTKKIPGVQEYSSEGVHVTLEMELPDAYLDNKPALQEQIQSLITDARDQVEHQLSDGYSRLQLGAPSSSSRANSSGRLQPSTARPASNKQLNFLLSLAKRARNLGAQDICQEYGISNLQELSSRQASELIERLKSGTAA